jgi:hypothetical protein
LPIPSNFDPEVHMAALQEHVLKTAGEGWKITTVDIENHKVMIERPSSVTMTDKGTGQQRKATLQEGVKKTDAEKWNAIFAADNPGYYMVSFDPHNRQAILEQMSPEAHRCRQSIANALGVKEWEVYIRQRKDGFEFKLPPNYVPSKHLDKITEVAHDVIGNIGWRVVVNAEKLQGRFIIGDPPIFPNMIPYPFPKEAWPFDPKGNWASHGVGHVLGGEEFSIDFSATPHVAVAGTSGGGKWQPSHTPIPVPVSEKFRSGWATMGEIEPGDYVFDQFGVPTLVIAKTPETEHEIIEVSLDDGQVIEVSEGHLWRVSTQKDRINELDRVMALRGHNPTAEAIKLVGYGHQMIEASHEFAGRCLDGTLDDLVSALPDEIQPIALEALSGSELDNDGVVSVSECLWTVGTYLTRTIPNGDEKTRVVSTKNLSPSMGHAIRLPREALGKRAVQVPSVFEIKSWLSAGNLSENPVHGIYDRSEILDSIVASYRKATSDGSMILVFETAEIARDVVRFVRSLGRKALVQDCTVEIVQPQTVESNTTMRGPVLSRTSVGASSATHLHITDVHATGRTASGHCIMVANPSGVYLTNDYVPTHNSILVQSLIVSALTKQWGLVIVDPVKGGVDFAPFQQYVRDSGWGCESLEEAVTALDIVYQEGVKRKKMVKDAGVQKWSELPLSLGIRPILVVTDEVSSMLIPETVPKLPKDDPMVIEVTNRNACKSKIGILMGKIARELRFVGVHLVVSSQVSQSATGVSTELRSNLGTKLLLGVNPTDGTRALSLNNKDAVPKVPQHIAEDKVMNRGVGVFEREGTPPVGVMKGYFASMDDFTNFLVSIGTKKTAVPRPSAREIQRSSPGGISSMDEDYSGGGDDEPPTRTSGSKPIMASVSAPKPEALARPAEVCSTCDGPINPLTGECNCSI